MQNTSTSTILFFASTLAMVAYARLSSFKKTPVSKAVLDLYASTLNDMFRAVKLPPRHTTAVETTTDIFSDRRTFFQNVFRDTKLLGKAKVIHVAGTKGKGSTCEYIAAALNAAGKKVGVFTSPHIHTARERIRIGRELISMEDLTRVGQSSLSALSEKTWSVFFDIFLCAALFYFGENNVEYIILECGIGGRYDSTNFVDSPAACVITSISLDHQLILGETEDKIAWQKAGIMKPKCDVFTTANQLPLVMDVFRSEAKAVDTKLHEVASSLAQLKTDDAIVESFVLHSTQVDNACIAAALLKHLEIPIDGMSQFYWPCRMEIFNVSAPFVKGKTTVILDGCHNGDSVKKFLSGVRSKYPDDRILSLFGAGAEKCVDDMLSELVLGSNQIIFIKSKHQKAISEDDLEKQVRPMLERSNVSLVDVPETVGKGENSVSKRLRFSLEYAQNIVHDTGARNRPVICIFGSLFAAAEAREALARIDPSLFSPA